MAIDFHPKPGHVLVGDFNDLFEPEICNIRPVIVVSPRLPFRSNVVTVVPISTTPPRHDVPYVCRLSRNYRPDSPDDLPSWAKCDMVMAVALRRLEAFKVGRRAWETPMLSDEDFEAVRRAVAAGLRLDRP